MLKIENVIKSFGDNHVLKGINMICEPGEVNGLVGANGAGKSTLFQAIVGLQSVSGKISWSEGNIRNSCGFLPTDPPIISRITGYEYLRLVTQARGLQISDFDEPNIFELPLDRYVENYSTGMKKKIALLGVLLQKNNIFILDEPFNGLDLQSNLIVVEIIRKLKSKGKIVIISSHIFSLLEDLCDKVHYLNNGIIEQVADRSSFAQLSMSMKEQNINAKLDNLDI